ncbi:hypothetical protein SCHPADRAFT_677279 [Schizopora paradoxa]|uniref:O-methyltransferase dimerisation domain-containing protein n=1 Tax=Schizopora paradoxa TaxID=27342 RepID=A0A0H2R620_9AGAM|nr:hypothetical protein SCHPADRAFT_677279 [Schizopora paradoxa]
MIVHPAKKSTLKALVEIIAQNVDALDAAMEERGVSAPSLDEPFAPGSDVTNGQPQLIQMADLICRAATHLIHVVEPPKLSVLKKCSSHLISASIRCAIDLHISEILKEAGPDGLHVTMIAEKCGVEVTKLETVLRCLAGSWIFKEVRPNVFANSRLSSLLDKGQPVEDLRESPENMYKMPQAAILAVMSFLADDALKSSAFLLEALTDPQRSFSGEAKDSSFSMALNCDKSYWDFIQQPDQKARLARLGIAMDGTRMVEPPGLALTGYQWGSLPDGATVVDVGGGMGATSFRIAEAFPKLRFVVQDSLENTEKGKKVLIRGIHDKRCSKFTHLNLPAL